MAVDGRLEFIDKEMCVTLTKLCSFPPSPQPDRLPWMPVLCSKRIEKQISEIEEKIEKKKIEVCNVYEPRFPGSSPV